MPARAATAVQRREQQRASKGMAAAAPVEPTEELQPTQDMFEEGMMEQPTEALPTQVVAASEPPTQDLGRSQRQPRSLEEWVQLGAAFAEQRNKVSKTVSAKRGRAASFKMAPPAPPAAARASRSAAGGKFAAQPRGEVEASAASVSPTQDLEPTQDVPPTQELAAEPAPLVMKAQPPQAASRQGDAVGSAPAALRPHPSQVASREDQAVAKRQRSTSSQSPGHLDTAAPPKRFQENVDILLASVQPQPPAQPPAQSPAQPPAQPAAPSVPGFGAKVYRRQARVSLREQAGPRTREAAEQQQQQRPEVLDEEMLTQELPPSQDLAVPRAEAPGALMSSLATFGAPPRGGGIGGVVLPPKRRSFIELVQLGLAVREKIKGGGAPEEPAAGTELMEGDETEAGQPEKRLRLADGVQEEPLAPTEDLLPPALEEQDGHRAFEGGEPGEAAEEEQAAEDAAEPPSPVGSAAAAGDAGAGAEVLAIADVDPAIPAGAGLAGLAGLAGGTRGERGGAGAGAGEGPEAESEEEAVATDLAPPSAQALAKAPGSTKDRGISAGTALASRGAAGVHQDPKAGEAAAAVELVVSMLRQQRSGGAAGDAEQAEKLLQGLLSAPAGTASDPALAPPPAAAAGATAPRHSEDSPPPSSQELATIEKTKPKRKRTGAPAPSPRAGMTDIDAIEAAVRELEEREEETRGQLSALITQKASSVEETVRQLQRRKEAVVGVLHALKTML